MPEHTKEPTNNTTRHSRPSFLAAMRLRCPHCCETPMQEEGSWFNFRRGCLRCDYLYEREPGYFWGASWMISYTVACALALGIAAYLFIQRPQMDGLTIALIAVAPVLPAVLFLQPYSRALWLWADHVFHPLDHEDHLPPAPTA